MSPDANTIASILGTVATGGLAAWAARSAKRTKRQENRDDFAEHRKALNERIDGLKSDVAEQRTEMAAQRKRIGDQDAALNYLLRRVGVLVGYIRKAGMEPPAPAPMPDRVRTYLDHIDG